MQDSILAQLTLLFFGSELALFFGKRSRGSPGATRSDRGSIRVLWIVITLAITMAIVCAGFPPTRLPFQPSTIRVAALALMTAGLAVRWWAVVTLGRFFTVDVATHVDHTLIDDKDAAAAEKDSVGDVDDALRVTTHCMYPSNGLVQVTVRGGANTIVASDEGGVI
jgi:hypothetical protein